MKEVKAYIKPHKLEDVVHALHGVQGLTGMSAVEVKGFGRGSGEEGERYRVDEKLELLGRQTKVEVVCRDDLVEEVLSTIQGAACTGLRGDGKIYVSSVEEALRIETGERGERAV